MRSECSVIRQKTSYSIYDVTLTVMTAIMQNFIWNFFEELV